MFPCTYCEPRSARGGNLARRWDANDSRFDVLRNLANFFRSLRGVHGAHAEILYRGGIENPANPADRDKDEVRFIPRIGGDRGLGADQACDKAARGSTSTAAGPEPATWRRVFRAIDARATARHATASRPATRCNGRAIRYGGIHSQAARGRHGPSG